MRHFSASRRHSRRSASRHAFSLVEVAIAMFVVAVVSLTGFAYYGTARVSEINEWHDSNALFLCEREIEAWHTNGYTGLTGFGPGAVSPNFLPYGYRFGSPDPDWDQVNSRKVIVLNGFTYHVRARNIWTHNTGNDYYVEENWGGGVIYRYRRLEIQAEWGFDAGGTPAWDMTQETRMAR